MSQYCFCGSNQCTAKYADLRDDSNQFLNPCALLRFIRNLKIKQQQNREIVVPNHQPRKNEALQMKKSYVLARDD